MGCWPVRDIEQVFPSSRILASDSRLHGCVGKKEKNVKIIQWVIYVLLAHTGHIQTAYSCCARAYTRAQARWKAIRRSVNKDLKKLKIYIINGLKTQHLGLMPGFSRHFVETLPKKERFFSITLSSVILKMRVWMFIYNWRIFHSTRIFIKTLDNIYKHIFIKY